MAILRVGTSRLYTTINSAISAAPGNDDLIVIDPDTYNEAVLINKWVNLLANTDTPENGDIIIDGGGSAAITINYSPSVREDIYIEGVQLQKSYGIWTVSYIVLGSNTNLGIYLNRCRILSGSNMYPLDPNSFPLHAFYVENCYVERGYSHVVYGDWTAFNESGIIKTQTNDAYYCYICTGSPDTLDTVATPTTDYGPAYGSYYKEDITHASADLAAYIAVLEQIASFNVWAQGNYVFKPGTYGVEVYGFPSENLLGVVQHTPANTGPVWANDDYLYISTTDSGVLRSPMSSISSAIYDDLSVYKNYPDISSDWVNYIHGAGNYLCVATISGAHIFDLTTGSGVYDNTSIAGTKCYQMADRTSYYIYDNNLKTVYNDNSTYLYTSGDGIIPTISGMNDIHVVSGTKNVILLATTNGAVVIEENKGDEVNSRFKYYYIEEN